MSNPRSIHKPRSSKTRTQRDPIAILHQKLTACRAETDSLLDDLRIKKQNNESLVALNTDLIAKNRELKALNASLTASNTALTAKLESLIFELDAPQQP